MGFSSGSGTADSCLLVLVLLVALTLSVETSRHTHIHTLLHGLMSVFVCLVRSTSMCWDDPWF